MSVVVLEVSCVFSLVFCFLGFFFIIFLRHYLHLLCVVDMSCFKIMSCFIQQELCLFWTPLISPLTVLLFKKKEKMLSESKDSGIGVSGKPVEVAAKQGAFEQAQNHLRQTGTQLLCNRFATWTS